MSPRVGTMGVWAPRPCELGRAGPAERPGPLPVAIIMRSAPPCPSLWRQDGVQPVGLDI